MPETSYRRRAPAEWVELVDLADTKLSQTDNCQPPVDAVDAVWDAARSLDDEQLESARYYGLGLAMSGLTKALHHEGTRQTTVDAAADRLLISRKIWGSRGRDGIGVGDLRVEAMFSVFDTLTRQSLSQLTPGERLSVETLGMESYTREDRLISGEPTEFTVSKRRQSILEGDGTLQNIRNNTTAAMISLIQNALVKRRELAAGRPAWGGSDAPSIAEITEGASLEDMNLVSLAISSATLRRDEFMSLDFIVIKDGQAHFNRNVTSKVASLEQPCNDTSSPVLHTSRLKCPALSQQGLIPTIADIIIKAIIQAQERTDERN